MSERTIQVQAMLDSGMRQSEVAAALGIKRQSIYELVSRHKLRDRPIVVRDAAAASMHETFAERFRRLRHASGLSQTAVAELCGCSKIAVAHWEGARCMPSFARMPKVAKALGCSLDMLRNGREAPRLAALLRAIRVGTPMAQLVAMAQRDA